MILLIICYYMLYVTVTCLVFTIVDWEGIQGIQIQCNVEKNVENSGSGPAPCSIDSLLVVVRTLYFSLMSSG